MKEAFLPKKSRKHSFRRKVLKGRHKIMKEAFLPKKRRKHSSRRKVLKGRHKTMKEAFLPKKSRKHSFRRKVLKGRHKIIQPYSLEQTYNPNKSFTPYLFRFNHCCTVSVSRNFVNRSLSTKSLKAAYNSCSFWVPISTFLPL